MLKPGDVVRLRQPRNWVPGLIETYGNGPHICYRDAKEHGFDCATERFFLVALSGEMIRYPEGSHRAGEWIMFCEADLERDQFLTAVYRRRRKINRRSIS